MSGVFLTLWDGNNTGVLTKTDGGWPHVTLAYTGSVLSPECLCSVAQQALQEWALKPLTLTGVRVNSFFHEKEGRTRHDVFLLLGEAEAIERSRDALLRTRYDCSLFCMREPHVTVVTSWSEKEALQAADSVSKLLPLTVSVTGVTID